MKVIIVKAGKFPKVEEIDNNLKQFQSIVGGYIEALYPWDDNACIICNEDGKINGMALNRALRDAEDNVYDVVAGDFIIAGISAIDFCGLSDNQIAYYSEMFHYPQMFANINGRLSIVPSDTEF